MLEVNELTAGYGRLIVIRDVFLNIEKGEILSVIGANGAGKSTLLWCISGLIRAKSGNVIFNGKDITNLEPNRIVKLGICHVLQGMQVFANLTVETNLILAGYGTSNEMKDIKHNYLKESYTYFPVLEAKKSQLAGSLSGGEKQMLALARVLISKPTLLLLDEPSTGLAPLLVTQLFKMLRKLKSELEITILLVEQNAIAALKFADKGLVMAHGKVMLEGNSKSLLNDEKVKEVYLGLEEKDKWQTD